MNRNLLAAAMAALATCPALAQQSPWYVGVAQGLTHTSNVQSVPDGQPASSSTISITSLVGGLDQPIGRQRLYGSASLRRLAYSGHSNLNNSSYDLNLGLDWATVERISGTLSAQASRRLDLRQALDLANNAIVGVKNEQSNESLQATARVGVVTALTLEGSLGWRRQDMSLANLDEYDYSSTTTSLGLRYRFSGALQAGAALRHTQYDYPRYLGASNQVKRSDLDLTATWVPSGASRLNARLSVGRSSQSAALQGDFSGATGLLRWQWQPTAKISVDTSVQRDTGVDTDVVYFGTGSNVSRSDDSRLTNTLATSLSYAATSKINLKAGLRWNERDLVRNNLAGSDQFSSMTLGATWQPTRSVQVGCDASHEQRSTSGNLSLPYKVATMGCSVQLVLQ